MTSAPGSGYLMPVATIFIENEFTRTRSRNFSRPLFSNGRDRSSLDLGNEKQMSTNVTTKVILCHRDIFTYYVLT